MEKIVTITQNNLAENDIEFDQLLADAGYSSGTALAFLETTEIDAWIPNFGQYVPEREGFIFNKDKNQYECQKEGGNRAILVYKGIKTDSKNYQKNQYRSSEKDCKDCPLRESCCGKVTKYKKLDDSIHKALYDKMHQKLQAHKQYAKRMVKIRSKTVEPVLGTLINFLNMKKINSRGIKQANKHILMAALTYNLKKYMKFCTKKPKIAVQIIEKPKQVLAFFETTFLDLIFCFLSPRNFQFLTVQS